MSTTIYSGEREQRGNFLVSRLSFSFLAISIVCFCLVFLSACKTTQKLAEVAPAAKPETASISFPKVTNIDEQGLRDLLKPTGKPRLINFWATWCGPCREEFPDLVKIGNDHKGKIELITVSLDDPAEIDGEVSKFLAEMRSDSPAFLLKTVDEDAAIALVSKDWQGALPFTILLDPQGSTVYSKQGKFKTDVLVAAIEKL